MELMHASNQWMKRPKDERFSSLEDLHEACKGFTKQARIAQGVPWDSIRVQADGTELLLTGKANIPSKFTHHAFGQLCTLAGSEGDMRPPAGYLRSLPATLAAQNLNWALARKGGLTNLLLHQNGGYHIRCFNGPDYTRIWNDDITERLLKLHEQSNGQWNPAPAGYDGSRGLYASDHDMFAFLVDNNRRIFEKDPNGGLSRGFFVWNAEVPGKSFGVMTFYYNYVCGNHIVWGAEGVTELRIRHVGEADERAFRELTVELKKYSEASTHDDEEKIVKAKAFELGKDKEEVLDRIFGLRVPQLSKKLLGDAYTRAEQHEDWYGNPRSAWGMTQGLTELARDSEFADKRVELERAAGRVMTMAF